MLRSLFLCRLTGFVDYYCFDEPMKGINCVCPLPIKVFFEGF